MQEETSLATNAGVAPGAIPDHVPPALARHFTFGFEPEFATNPYTIADRLVAGPEIFYAIGAHGPYATGWMVTRYETVREVMTNPEIFSSRGFVGWAKLIGEDWDQIPLEVDPPAHLEYRMLLNPLFAPKRIEQLDAKIRALAINLIDAFAPRGECEFIEDFAKRFPIFIFLELMGLPLSEADKFMSWSHNLIHNPDMAAKASAVASIANYLRDVIADRRKRPTDDVAGFVVQADIRGRKLSEDELIGVLFLFFNAGLDTVLAALGWQFRYLAETPAAQERLRADPAQIPLALEELMRAFSTVPPSRICTRDVEFHGIQMKKGDRVMCPTMVVNRDPREFPNADQVIFGRESNRHIAFGSGPHRCMGSHLARRELRIAYEEFLGRIPPFRIRPGAEVTAYDGIWGLYSLPLEWKTAR